MAAAWPELQASGLRPLLDAAGYARNVLDGVFRTFRPMAG